ncbi:MAG: GNAT family N-acetyltransferase [Dehalococcoidia bacterium]|nr:GNAT family N-acetyltransferase [Dehalococcoidia bacterium]
MTDTPSTYTGRLVRLRAREPEDEPLLYAWFNDPSVTEHLAIRYPLSHRDEHAFLERAASVSYAGASFAVVTRADDRLIGGVSLERTSPENRSAVLGVAIGDRTCWDGGYGTDAMRTVCRVGFEMMNLHRVELDVFAANERARHVYEKVGFRLEGRRRDAHYKHGRYQDVLVMGLLEGELRLD